MKILTYWRKPMDKIGMFRGKIVDKNEWVYGYFIKSTDDRCFIGKNLYVHEKKNPSTLKQTFDAIEVDGVSKDRGKTSKVLEFKVVENGLGKVGLQVEVMDGSQTAQMCYQFTIMTRTP